ncbi:beta-hexosaminidase subunit beta-like [Oratosquilla oratoria]|uniref:beta-hexosaminidase subunit beta-like n=1 Tax=Oratosquilla oratoria TaxID=337810 RepID=UPI003F7720CC
MANAGLGTTLASPFFWIFILSIQLLQRICIAEAKLVYVEENLPLPGKEAPPGSPWPLPREWIKSDVQLTVDPDPDKFEFIHSLPACDVIVAAVDRYDNLIRRTPPEALADPNLKVLPALTINITAGCDHTPRLNLDPENEAYTLDIKLGAEDQNATAQLESRTVWGALRGLETFSQLVHFTESPQEPSYYRVNVTFIRDAPRFPHRGLLLDTARHFLTKNVLFQVLDSMEWNKLNVFHWHIVDDQSFPYACRIFPNLTEHGAYTPQHVYSQRDVADIVDYARFRGIRVVPEFDTPGHTQGFGKAFPHLLTPCYGDGKNPGTPNYPYHAAYENLDPTNPQVYDFLNAFLVELQFTFVDGFVHLGLDEVFLPCWKSSPVVKDFMKNHSMTEVREVERYYAKNLLSLAEKTRLKYIVWQDPADSGIELANSSVVQVWKDSSLSPSKMRSWREYMHDLTKNGHRAILSSCWYLNYISYGQDWRNFYNCDPTDFQGTEEQKKLVLGGEAAMWGEYVDSNNLLPRLWPRASAAAERLWSAPLEEAPSADEAAHRLDQHRCRMLRRGVPAQPILNGFCGAWEVPQDIKMSTPRPITISFTPTPHTTESTTSTSTTTTTPTTTTTTTTTTSSTTTTTTPPPPPPPSEVPAAGGNGGGPASNLSVGGGTGGGGGLASETSSHTENGAVAHSENDSSSTTIPEQAQAPPTTVENN